jgi:hypothetical protein
MEGMDVSDAEAALVEEVLRDNPTPTREPRRLPPRKEAAEDDGAKA